LLTLVLLFQDAMVIDLANCLLVEIVTGGWFYPSGLFSRLLWVHLSLFACQTVCVPFEWRDRVVCRNHAVPRWFVGANEL